MVLMARTDEREQVAYQMPVIGGVGWPFVIAGTRAFKAWAAYRRSIGRPINYAYAGDGIYQGKTGRHFPSLFPPGQNWDATDEAWQARNPAQNGIQSGDEAK